MPGRGRAHTEKANRDFAICHAVTVRLHSLALTWLLTEDARYKDAALVQMRCLFDHDVWPAWRDIAHPPPADLRTGQLAFAVALAYDWLHAGLSATERDEVVAGLDAQAIQPYVQAIPAAWWFNSRNNWLTVITGQLGILAMALGDAHPASAEILAGATDKLRGYLDIYGPEGEFNESPMYANANSQPVQFFAALSCHAGGERNPLARHPFPAMCRWVMHATDPGGHVLPFGDSPLRDPVKVGYFAAVAAATRDPVLQGFFVRHWREEDVHRHGNPAIDLLSYDPALPAAPPAAWNEPPAHAYRAHGGLVVSRANWHDPGAICVASKSGATEGHGHHDAGQLIIQAGGQWLIADPGSLHYPADYFDSENRWRYYNASVFGHNLITLGGREVAHADGRLVDFEATSERVRWSIDLTPCHPGARRVQRTVEHRLPGEITVRDDIDLPKAARIALRWHTAGPVTVDETGAFTVEADGYRCDCQVVRLDNGALQVATGRHAYKPPFDRNRLGGSLNQKHEPYVEATTEAESCRIQSTFIVISPRVYSP